MEFKARFVTEETWAARFTGKDHDDIGVFIRDDGLNKFLTSGPCASAAIRVLLTFLVDMSERECRQQLASYVKMVAMED